MNKKINQLTARVPSLTDLLYIGNPADGFGYKATAAELAALITPIGGTAGQILAKVNSTNFNTEWIDNYTSSVKHIVKAGVAVTKGNAGYISSADGTNMIVSKASNVNDALSATTIGIVAETLAINGQGFVITEGLLAGLNTSTATIGDPIWLGVDGALIFGLANKPVAPAHLVYLGTVTRVHSVNGEIFVKVNNGWELEELHDVLITSPITGQLLRRDSDNLWKNWTPNYVPQSRTITINGTTYDLSADRSWTVSGTNIYSADGTLTSARTLTLSTYSLTIAGTTSSRFHSNGRVTIGTVTDSGYQFDVNGTVRFQNTLTLTGNGTNNVINGTGGTFGTFSIDSYSRINATGITLTNTNYTSASIIYSGFASIGNGVRIGSVLSVSGYTWGNGYTGAIIGDMRFATNAMVLIGGSYQGTTKYNNSAALLQIGMTASDWQGDTTADITITGYTFVQKYDITRAGSVLIGYDYNPTFVTNAGKHYASIWRSGQLGVGTSTPHASSLIEIASTTQGFLPPRMTTTQKNAISSPANGLVIFDTTLNKLCVYTTAWETITSV